MRSGLRDAAGRLIDHIRDFAMARDERHVACLDLDNLRVDALSHLTQEARIDGAILGGDHGPARARTPGRLRHRRCEVRHIDRHLAVAQESCVGLAHICSKAVAKFF